MKWKSHPPYGTQRTRTRFAWLPVDLDNDVTVWLTSYRETCEYRAGGWFSGPGWEVVRVGPHAETPHREKK